jgi:hypothetical protein
MIWEGPGSVPRFAQGDEVGATKRGWPEGRVSGEPVRMDRSCFGNVSRSVDLR